MDVYTGYTGDTCDGKPSLEDLPSVSCTKRNGI